MERIKIRLYFLRLWGRNFDLSVITYNSKSFWFHKRRYRQTSWFYKPHRWVFSLRLFKWEMVLDYKQDL
jgi:hypothetical protein